MVNLRTLLCVVSVAALTACGSMPYEPTQSPLGLRAESWMTVTGAPLASVTAAGAPRSFAGPYTRLVAPIAVAARGTDVLIADAGRGRVFRLDLMQNVMSVLEGAVARPDTGLYLSPDGIAYVTDTARREVVRYARGGQVLQPLRDDALLSRPVAVTVDERSGRVWVGEGLFQYLVMFNPAGRAAIDIPLRGGGGGPGSITALAVGGDGLYVADALCSCVFQLAESGHVLATIGQGLLRQPVSVAADHHGRLFVLDRFDNRILVFARARMVGQLQAPAATVMDSIFVDGSMMYIASGAGARVDVMRLVNVSLEVMP